MMYDLFVSCPKGLEYLLEEELQSIGLKVQRVSPQGVYGEANLATLYQLCLWSRIANRVQLILFSGHVYDEQTLYKLCHQFPWQTVFSADKTFAIEFHGASDKIRNTMFGAQVVKDAIVDYFRSQQGARPSIDRDEPQIKLHAHLKQETLTVSFDLSGYSLHQRGYRQEKGRAPLKENIAAAMLIRAKWPQLAEKGYALHDPFCGSGTLVIEAAMMAARIAPGILRNDQSLHHWAAHQASLWEKMRVAALKNVKPLTIKLHGTDSDKRLISMATANAERAGVSRLVSFDALALSDCKASADTGLVICNPPYGERLQETTQLIPLYQQLGQILYSQYPGWLAAFLTSNPMLAKATGLRAGKQYTLYNGALECKLYCLTISENKLKDFAGKLSQGADMFRNRLQKNYKRLQKWAQRQQINCYRVYDADLPEYAYAIDVYDGYVVLAEYAAPASVSASKAEQRSLDVMQVVPSVLNVSPDHMVVKQRKPQKGLHQYQKVAQSKHTLMVQEGKAEFKVNLYDYLDTGLFLDHRPLRLRFGQLKAGTRFLNCFCYTATASVHAALSGVKTTNVDLSNTYLQWARENFKVNQLNMDDHQFIQADCLEWMKTAKDQFDVIFLDPPSFSNSKRMDKTLDIQRDHEDLIHLAMRLLAPDGQLFFSTNLRRFRLTPAIAEHFDVRDISQETIDVDFQQNKRIHHCYLIQKKQ